MPIRHCQKCGLKVLIDESQTTANPFYCQRCAATAKAGGGGGGGGGAPAKEADPIPMVSKRETGSPPAQPSAPSGGKGGPVKVLCPYCKASFSGRLPAKPAKGACPVCQKELVLLPDGKIKPAATFDLAKWQKEQEMQRATGDPAVAEQARAVQRALERSESPEPEPAPVAAISETPTPPPERTVPLPPPAPEPEPEPVSASVPEPSIIAPPKPSDDIGGLAAHTMLDMGRPSDLDDLVRAAAPRGKTQVREAEDPLAVLGNEPPMGGASTAASEAPGPSESEADIQTMRRRNEQDGPVAGEPVPVPVSSKSPPQVEPKEPPPPPAPSGPRPSMAKLVFGGLLVILPLAAGAVMIFMRNNAQLENVLNRVGTIVDRGLKSLHERVSKATVPAPPAPKREPAKKVDEPAKSSDTPDEATARKTLQEEMQDLWGKIRIAERNIKKYGIDPSEDMKTILEDEKKKRDGYQQRFDELQEAYKKRFNEEFKPQDQ